MAWIEDQGARLLRGTGQAVQQRRQRLNDLSRAMPRAESLLESPRQRLDQAGYNLPRALMSAVQQRHVNLSRASAGLRPAALRNLVQRRRGQFETAIAKLSPYPIAREISRQKADLEKLTARMVAAQGVRMARQSHQLDAAGRQLEILSYKATLLRGYAVVRSGAEVITTQARAAAAPSLTIEFADGNLDVEANEAVK